MIDDATFNAFMAEFRANASDFKLFQGTMVEFKENTKQKLAENSVKLQAIESKLNTPTVCQFHTIITAQLEKQKDKDDEHDEKIVEGEKRAVLVDYKLSLNDTAKIAGLSAILATPLVEIFRMLLDAVLKRA